jgi:hypothetical protein
MLPNKYVTIFVPHTALCGRPGEDQLQVRRRSGGLEFPLPTANASPRPPFPLQ